MMSNTGKWTTLTSLLGVHHLVIDHLLLLCVYGIRIGPFSPSYISDNWYDFDGTISIERLRYGKISNIAKNWNGLFSCLISRIQRTEQYLICLDLNIMCLGEVFMFILCLVLQWAGATNRLEFWSDHTDHKSTFM